MRVALAAAFLTLCLGGCITKAVQEKQLTEAGPKDDAYCQSIGAKPETPTYTQCRLVLRQQMLTEQAEARERLSKVGDAMMQVSQNISNQQAAVAAANASRNINCTSTRFGNQVSTSCY